MSLKVKFIGAVDAVTGSCSLLHYERSNSYYLVDCGMYQGFPGAEERNRRPFDFDPARLSAVFLTHAHLDHCGLLPRLVREGFKGKIICTSATAKLTINTLFDSAQISSLCSKADVKKVRELFQCPDEENPRFQWGHFYPVENDLFYGFLRTAHVAGSVAIQFRFNTTPDKHITVLFSGDIGPVTDGAVHGGLLKPRQYPNPSTSFLITESTYGGRTRGPEAGRFKERIRALGAGLRKAFARGPNPVVLLPVFSLQRTQEVLADLHYVFTRVISGNGSIPTVIMDSPLAHYQTKAMYNEFLKVKTNGRRLSLNEESPLFSECSSQQADELLSALFAPDSDPRTLGEPGAQWQLVMRPEKGFCATGPVLWLSGSGTCQAGRIVKHLADHLANPQATVIFTGYQPSNAPGDTLKQLHAVPKAERGRLTIELGEESIPGTAVEADICDLSAHYSGHADEDGLIDFIRYRDTDEQGPAVTVFINHGDPKARLALKKRLEASVEEAPGLRPIDKVILPETGSGWFDFIKRRWIPDTGSSGDAAQMAELKEMLFEVLHNQREILRILKYR